MPWMPPNPSQGPVSGEPFGHHQSLLAGGHRGTGALDWYACTTEAEYFARLSDAWFSVHVKDFDRWSEFSKLRQKFFEDHPKLAKLAPRQTGPITKSDWVKKNDEKLYELMKELYGDPRKL